MPILVIGAGRVGTAVSYCLKKRGARLLAVTTRSRARQERLLKKFGLHASRNFSPFLSKAGLILLAVNDDALREVAASIHESQKLRPGTFLGHFSGTAPSTLLAGQNSWAFSLHPLRAFADFHGDCSVFKETAMVFEGDRKALPIARALARALGGRFMRIARSKKALYHAAACMTGNYLVTLAAMAARLNQKAGIPEKESVRILLPLLQSTLSNIEKIGIPASLTGPIERGDTNTLAAHLKILRKTSQELLTVYRTLGVETVKLAKAKGLSSKKAEQMKELLEKP